MPIRDPGVFDSPPQPHPRHRRGEQDRVEVQTDDHALDTRFWHSSQCTADLHPIETNRRGEPFRIEACGERLPGQRFAGQCDRSVQTASQGKAYPSAQILASTTERRPELEVERARQSEKVEIAETMKGQEENGLWTALKMK